MAQQKIGGVTRRTFVKGGLAASALAALAACKNDAGGTSEGASGATLNYYINNPVSIDPYNAQEDQGMQVCYQLFDALTIYDFDTDELMGLAAESWMSTTPRTSSPSTWSRVPRSTTATR